MSSPLAPLVTYPPELLPMAESSNPRDLMRTPSPTPSEQAALRAYDLKRPHLQDILKKLDIRRADRRTLRTAIVLAIVITLLTLLIVYNNQIIHALEPATNWMKRTKGGWVIPIAVLIILSFPPLFGHEIVILLVGFTWGLGIGTAITFAGTLFGEILTYYVFKYACGSRQQKYEDRDMRYACLSRVARDGGWRMVTIVRYSSIPSHLSTALFAMIGIDIWTFLVAAILALPKQLATVALGYELARSGGGPDGNSTQSRILQVLIGAVTGGVTIAVSRYLHGRQAAVIEDVVHDRRKLRQAQMAAAAEADRVKVKVEVGEDTIELATIDSGTPLHIYAPAPVHYAR